MKNFYAYDKGPILCCAIKNPCIRSRNINMSQDGATLSSLAIIGALVILSGAIAFNVRMRAAVAAMKKKPENARPSDDCIKGPNEYEFHYLQTFDGHKIAKLNTNDHTIMGALCDALSECKGYTMDGYLRNKIAYRKDMYDLNTNDPKEGLYVKQT